MTYLILAQICSTVGTPDWCVVMCYVIFGLKVSIELARAIIKIVKEEE